MVTNLVIFCLAGFKYFSSIYITGNDLERINLLYQISVFLAFHCVQAVSEYQPVGQHFCVVPQNRVHYVGFLKK